MEDAKAYFSVQTIPIEMWNLIFQYTNTENDLNNLSMVCRSFHQIITEMPDFKDRMMLKVSGEKESTDFHAILSSPRNYRKMTIQNVEKFETFSEIFEKFAPNLNYLKIVECRLSKHEMIKIFQMTSSNLKILHLERLPNIPRTEVSIKFSFKFQQLETLLFLNCDFFEFFDYFPDTLKSFSFYSFTGDIQEAGFMEYYDENHIEPFSNFLLRQANLKNLTIYIVITEDIHHGIYLRNFGTNMKFKLESLEINVIECSWFYISENTEFENFLKSQSASLESLKLNRFIMDLNNFDVTFPLLKKFTFDVGLPLSQRELGANFCYSNFNEIFPNLLEIVVNMEEHDLNLNEFCQNISQNYQNLKKLTLEVIKDSWLMNVVFDNIEELTVKYLNADNQYKIDHMFTAFKNLKVLKIQKPSPINSQFLAWILLNFKHLEHLVIENGSQLKNIYLVNMSQLFKNLKHLEIFNIQEPVDQFKQILDHQFPKLKYCVSIEQAIEDDTMKGPFPFKLIYEEEVYETDEDFEDFYPRELEW